MQILVPYGRGEALRVNLADERVAGIVFPNRVRLTDQEQILERALSRPLGSLSFDQFLQDAGELLIVVNDATRPTPTAEVLKGLIPLLKGLKVQFLVATGSHRAPTEEESRRIFGPLYERYRQQIAVHDARRPEEMIKIGTSQRGTELLINRRILEAPRILILVSKCRAGLGQETFARLLRSAPTPGDALDRIERVYRLGYHKAAKIAEIASWAQLWALTGLDDDLVEDLFIRPVHDLQSAIDEALLEKGPEARILFLMAGSLTVPEIAPDRQKRA